MTERPYYISELIRLHHLDYQDDIPFWIDNTERGNLILELGCGHGRVSIPLVKAERKIVGLDLDWYALLSLKSQVDLMSADLQDRIHLIQVNMLEFRTGKKIDSVIFPCNTYGSFSSEERKQLLFNLSGMLYPGGFFIASMPNPVSISSLHKSLITSDADPEPELENTFILPENDYPVQVSSLVSPSTNGVSWEWIYDILASDGVVKRYRRSNLIYLASLDIFIKELREAEFQVVAFYGDFDRAEYDQDSPYLILVARTTGN